MGSLKNLFIKKDDDEQQGQAAASQPTPAAQPAPQTFNVPLNLNATAMNADPSVGVSKANEEMVKRLWDTLVAKNFPGPDYLELKSHADALEPFMKSYDQRLLAAFNILKNQYPDFTVKMFTDAIDKYVKIIEEERKEGEAECERKLGLKVKNAEADYSDMEQKISDLQTEIAEKQKTLGEYIEKKTQLSQALSTARAEKDYQTQAFADSVESVLAFLASDKKTISQLQL